jgi:hypothetical protein
MKKKRYIVLKNNTIIGEANTNPEIYRLINCHRQHFNHIFVHSIFNTTVKYKNDDYRVIDKLDVK